MGDSLKHNPVAFFTACRFSTSETVAHMMKHCLRASARTASGNEGSDRHPRLTGSVFPKVYGVGYDVMHGCTKASEASDDYLTFKNLNFGPSGTTSAIKLRYSKKDGGGKVQFLIGGPSGTVIAETFLEPTGSWDVYTTVFIPIDDVVDTQDLTLKGQAASGINLHWLELTGKCPYPWILSNHISADGAKAMLKVYPQGVLQPSSCLSSLCPLDFFLMSPEMIKQRDFDKNIWTKFKLMLVAAECVADDRRCKEHNGLSPVRVILQRILSRPGCLDNMERARHILWLLQQLRRTDQWVFEKPSSDGLYPLQYVLGHECTQDKNGLVASRELVKLLISAHPDSARLPFSNGSLPIHVAVANGWPCHDLLLAVYPKALDIVDPVTGLVPFQAAATSDAVPVLSLDVTFELFRANPVNALRGLPRTPQA